MVLGESLGRDVGDQVAALDYVENVAQLGGVHRRGAFVPVGGGTLRRFLQHVGAKIEILLDSPNYQNFANLQAIMRGAPGIPVTQTAQLKNTAPPVESIRVPAATIARHASEIEQHKWFLGERLGRDVGPNVTALDYLQNVKQERPMSLGARVRAGLEGLMEASGPNSIANLERAMRVRHPTR